MALALPKLDNRNFDELVREGQRVIPQQAPQWTDHNIHDPGITLMDLFAWLVEQDMYRLDRVPDANIRAFLRLVGIEANSATAATTVLEIAIQASAAATIIPAGMTVSDASKSVIFETETETYLSTARLVAIVSETDHAQTDHRHDNATPGADYLPFGTSPVPGNCLYLGFDTALGQGGEHIALYIRSNDPEQDAETRTRLIEEWQTRQREAVAICPTDNRRRLSHWSEHYSARTVWEYWSRAGTWEPLENVKDETRALSLSGFVRFKVPADHAPSEKLADLWLVRCRLVLGQYECPPRISRIALNAVSVKHAALIREVETLGQSQGHAGEIFPLQHGPVVVGSVQLTIEHDSNVEETWREVTEWDRVAAHDRVFRLDLTQGQIIFGDGRHGRVPPAGATLRCRYRVCGGIAGNVAAHTLINATDSNIEVRQPYAAFGGADAETLDDARGKALAFLAERYRAISLDDFETLAVSTPGAPVARARALAGYYPKLPCVFAPGSITVVAIPACPGERPEASQDFLDAVYRWLMPRCALTTELYVVGPSYKAVAVQARVHTETAANIRAITSAATHALNQFFHPLEGGPDKTGWPVGRTVYRSEVMAVLNGIEGVAYVDQLSLLAEGESKASCANVTLCANEMAASGEHRIQVIERS